MTTLEATRAGRRDLAMRRILVVEDDYFVAQDLCTTLRDHGAHVVGPVPSIDAARAHLKDAAIDCVLLDINLDGEHAFELAAEARNAGFKVVFLTGYDFSFIPRELKPIDCLQKPVDTSALLRSILSGQPAT